MPLHFLKHILSEYRLEQQGSLFFFLKDPTDPMFCLLPFWMSQKKIKTLAVIQKSCPNLVYLRPLYRADPFFRKLLTSMQPLYFMTPGKDSSFLFDDRRYLHTVSEPYLLPPVSIKLSASFKNATLLSLEEELFFSSRQNVPFCFEGDTTHRLLNAKYLASLQKRKRLKKEPSHSVYKFLKKILDN